MGGRVHTIRGEAFSGGLHAEAGGESIDVDHTDLLALLDRFGLWPPRTARRTRSSTAHLLAGTAPDHRRLRGRPGRTRSARDYERYYAALDELAPDIDPEHPQ